jgi:hypothetical protein
MAIRLASISSDQVKRRKNRKSRGGAANQIGTVRHPQGCEDDLGIEIPAALLARADEK